MDKFCQKRYMIATNEPKYKKNFNIIYLIKYSRIKILRNPNSIIIKLRLIKFNNFLLIFEKN